MNNEIRRWWETSGFVSLIVSKLPEHLERIYRGDESADKILQCGARVKNALSAMSKLMESIPGIEYGASAPDVRRAVGIGTNRAAQCMEIRDPEKLIHSIGMVLSLVLNPEVVEDGVRGLVRVQEDKPNIHSVNMHLAKMYRCATHSLAAWWMLKRVVKCHKFD